MNLNTLDPHQPDLVGVVVGMAPQGGAPIDGDTLELLYYCNIENRNASSILLGAAYRAAEGMGYERVVVYADKNDGGFSLLATAFHKERLVSNGRLWRWVKHINQKKRSG